jgi:hypothetical protein
MKFFLNFLNTIFCIWRCSGNLKFNLCGYTWRFTLRHRRLPKNYYFAQRVNSEQYADKVQQTPMRSWCSYISTPSSMCTSCQRVLSYSRTTSYFPAMAFRRYSYLNVCMYKYSQRRSKTTISYPSSKNTTIVHKCRGNIPFFLFYLALFRHFSPPSNVHFQVAVLER